MSPSLVVEIRRLLDGAAPLLESVGMASDAEAIDERLDGPLRVAMAGRVKAGKSTLLNALVGERLAATDAGECTKVVTWYRHGIQYEVMAWLDDGTRRPVPFERHRDRLVLDLDAFDIDRLERLDVTWPSAVLRRFTLIDTPGLESHDEARAARTRQLLGIGEDGPSQVDAVVYLMRHAHRLDVEFLEAFTDRSLAQPSPVNAIAVLSRADEIGAGRLDALDSAAAVAGRYTADPRIRNLCVSVVPVAGLIGETGRTLQENEGASLATIASLTADETRPMVMSVDRFVDPERSPLDADTRRGLVLRLGLFGVRFALEQLGLGAGTTSDLARDLVRASGVERLTTLLDDHFARRADLLKSRSALANLKSLIARLPPSAVARDLAAEIERLEAAAPELGELRLLQLVISGAAGFEDQESEEVDRLVADRSVECRLGLPDDTSPDAVRAAIVERLDDWRRRSAFPLASSERREACEIVAATYERLYAEATPG